MMILQKRHDTEIPAQVQTPIGHPVPPCTTHRHHASARSLRLAPSNFCINPLQKEVKVPWVLQGAMLFSLVGAHAQAALLHSSKDLLWRVETAMCGCLVGIWNG